MKKSHKMDMPERSGLATSSLFILANSVNAVLKTWGDEMPASAREMLVRDLANAKSDLALIDEMVEVV